MDHAESHDPSPSDLEADAPERARRLRETARRADSQPQFVKTAKFIRRLLPGDDRYGDALSTSSGRVPERIGRMVSEVQPERPSAVRELGLGALQAWQALSEAQGRGRGTVDVAILFTDIVKFSPWALEAGDEAALELLRQVATVEDEAISSNGGSLVKRLGDGSMSVFGSPDDAVRSALHTHESVRDIEVEGHTPTLRAGVHVGRPRRVGSDYLGVDVNIAARVGECAKAGEVLVSDPAHAAMDGEGLRFGRKRRLRETGAPRDLSVRAVTAA